MKTLSVCIPTYEMRGEGLKFLKFNFDVLREQSFKDFEIIVSDNSMDNIIQDFCANYEGLDLKYVRNPGNPANASQNLNNALKHASGKIIKIIFQDDFLYHSKALEDIVNNFDLEKDNWLVTGYAQYKEGLGYYKTAFPFYNPFILFGLNTMSSPSVLAIKNEGHLEFDENLLWLLDCDYYARCHFKFGPPKILYSVNAVNREGSHQTTSKNRYNFKKKGKELRYVIKKHYKI